MFVLYFESLWKGLWGHRIALRVHEAHGSHICKTFPRQHLIIPRWLHFASILMSVGPPDFGIRGKSDENGHKKSSVNNRSATHGVRLLWEEVIFSPLCLLMPQVCFSPKLKIQREVGHWFPHVSPSGRRERGGDTAILLLPN